MKRLLILVVRCYQRWISPMIKSRCRYYPTCSQYMIDALYTHGAWKGFLMGMSRIFRCHPFVPGGIDYVPLHFSLKRNLDQTYHGPYTYRVYKKEKRK